jgi:hypothetical protein
VAKKLARERRLFIDFENIQQIDLSKIADNFLVTIFVGSNQKNLPFELVRDAQPLGEKINWLMIEGSGKNALDFHIAYYLGRQLAQSPKVECTILSKDTGFDPLVQHLGKKGFTCRRIENISDLETSNGEAPESNYKRLVDSLLKLGVKSKPGTRVKLANHISSLFQKKLPVAEIEQLIDRLFTEGKVTETDGTLTYSL